MEFTLFRCGGSWKDICNVIQKNIYGRRIIEDNFCKGIGDGLSIQFWLDNWLGDGFLKVKYFRFFVLCIMKDIIGVEMGVWDGWNWCWVMYWRRILYFWEGDQKKFLMKDLEIVNLNNFVKDRNVWRFNSLGDYFVKLFCKEWFKF